MKEGNFMKLKKVVLLSLCTVFAVSMLGGCGNSNQSTQKQEPVKVGQKAGIGDTLKRWQKDYGELKGKDMLKNCEINGSHVTVVFADDHALNITVEKKDNYFKNDTIKEMLPADMTETGKEKDTSDPALIKDRVTYHSDTLEKAIPETKGNFTTIDTSKASTKAYISTVIDCTPSK